MKTIAIFSGYALPHLGGIERYTHNLINELLKKEYRVINISSNYENVESVTTEQNLINIRIPIYNIFKNRYPIPKKNKEYKRLVKLLDQYNIDRIIVNTRFHLTSLVGAKYGKKNNIPVYLIEHGSSHLSVDNKILDFFGLIYEHLLTKYVERFVNYNYGVSQAACDWQKHFKIKSDGIWYNSINRFDDGVVINKKYDNIKIVYAGRILKQKGTEDLIVAFNKLCLSHKNIELLIAGDGNFLPYLKQKYDKNDKIKFLGSVDFKSLIKIYSDANIFVHPSNYPEGLPTSILEAGLMKCTVIATPNGGTRQFLNGHNGIVIDNNKYLYDTLESLVTNPKKIELMGNELKECIIENFLWSKTADKILKDINL